MNCWKSKKIAQMDGYFREGHLVNSEGEGFMETSRLDRTFHIIASVLILWFVLELFSVNARYLYMLPSILEWITQYMLPWAILYYLIKLVESRKER